MAIEEVNEELWRLATENVTKQQDEDFEILFDKAVDEHLGGGECSDCEDGLCSNCEELRSIPGAAKTLKK
jgi:hypothetical protein